MCCADSDFLQEKRPFPSGTSKGCRVLALPVTVALGLGGRGTESSSAELVPGQWLEGRGQSRVRSRDGEHLPSQAGD